MQEKCQNQFEQVKRPKIETLKFSEFNPQPLLHYLNQSTDINEVVRDLDTVMDGYFNLFAAERLSPTPDNYSAYYTLRQLRNAIILGFNGLNLG